MKLMFRSVVSWYKMSFMVYFELSWFLVWNEIYGENGQIWPFLHLANTPTPRRSNAHLGIGVHA